MTKKYRDYHDNYTGWRGGVLSFGKNQGRRIRGNDCQG